MDDIERICREINAENSNKLDTNAPQPQSSEIEIRNSSGSFVVLENDSELSLEFLSSDDRNSKDEKNTTDSPDEIQLPINHLDSSYPVENNSQSTPQSALNPVVLSFSQNQPPQPIAVKNQERFGRLTGVVITNGPNLNYEVGVGSRNMLYITNHDPGHVQPLPPHISNLQIQTDILTCALPFKYGIWFTILVIMVNFISLGFALFNYNECGSSPISLPFYVIMSAGFYIMRSFHDIVIYYFDCCWDNIIIGGRPLMSVRRNDIYEYHNLFGLILNIVLPILDTIVGVVFLVAFYNVCSRTVWIFGLVYIIICYPIRSIKMR